MATTPQNIIKTFIASLDNTTLSGVEAVDEAVRACSNYTSTSDLITHFIVDCKNSSSNGYFLRKYCGIKLYNEDTGAITGSDAGKATTKTAESVIPESGSSSYPSGSSFTKRGVTIVLPESNTLTTSRRRVIQGLYSWWLDSALDIIEESYGLTFNGTGTKIKTINLDFNYDSSSTTLAYVRSVNDSTVKLVVNMAYYDSISATDVNGEVSSSDVLPSFYLDRVMAHELTHAIMAANIDSFWTLPTFIIEGFAELTHGIDDQRLSDIVKLSQNPTRLEEYLNLYASGISTDTNTYAAGYMLLRYLAKQASGFTGDKDEDSNIILTDNDDEVGFNESNVTITAKSGNDNILNVASNVTIYGGNGNDSISSYGSNNITDGGTGNDYISNNGSDNVINGGTGNDYIYSDGSNNTIDGSTGDDYIGIGKFGDDYKTLLIYGGEGNDTIEAYSSNYSTILSGEGNDYIYSNGSNNTIDGGTGNDSIYSNGSNVTINAGDGNDIIDVSGSASYVGGTFVERINNTIYGGAGNDSIRNLSSLSAIFAGDDNDTIYNEAVNVLIDGGNGNDSISSNGDNLTINSGSGNDTIMTYSGDNLIINSDIGDDFVKIGGSNNTIDSGAGDDTIISSSHTSINSGSGNDVISGYFNNSTINTGIGNDNISLDSNSYSNIIQYASGDGNDTIINAYGEGYDGYLRSILNITSGNIESHSINGNDVILKIGSGSITLKDGKDKEFTIKDSSGILIKNSLVLLKFIILLVTPL